MYPAGDVTALMLALRSVVATPRLAEQMGTAALERIGSWGLEEDVAGLLRAIRQVTGWATG